MPGSPASGKRRPRFAIGLAAAALLCAPVLRADSAAFPLFPDGFPLISEVSGASSSAPADSSWRRWETAWPGRSPDAERFRLEISAPLRAALSGAPVLPQITAPESPVRQPHSFWNRRTRRLSLLVIASIPAVGEIVWWKESGKSSFHFTNERWFGADTYAGGADKASHIVFGYAATRVAEKTFESFGETPANARLLSLALTGVGGALVELGDGFTKLYGYSWEDVTSNLIGALAATAVSATHTEDLLGLRFGFVPAKTPPPQNRAYGYGHDYSEDIYSADLKLNGAIRRLGGRPGLARFLVVSMTYGSKGYRFSPVDHRERNVGVDVGLNVPEILLALGVPQTKWWGRTLVGLFEYVRVPYTAFGYQYDLNHHRWHGPSTGDRFDPGKVIYPGQQ